MKMCVQFFHPNGLKRGLPKLDWQVDTLEWRLPGGAADARLTAILPPRLDLNWPAWLDCPLEVVNESGEAVWSGYIEGLLVQQNGCQQEISSEGLLNRVRVRYRRPGFSGEDGGSYLWMDWVENPASVALYGRRERIITLAAASASEAAAYAANLVSRAAFPAEQIRFVPNKPENKVILRAKGWWSTLKWAIDAESAGRVAHLSGGKSKFTLGDAAAKSQIAQSFTVPAGGLNLGAVQVDAALFGAPGDALTLSVCADNGGQPGAVLGQVSLDAAELSGAWAWQTFDLAAPLSLSAGDLVWLVFSRSGALDALNHYLLQSDDGPGFAGGSTLHWNGSAWAAAGAALRFAALAYAPLESLIADLAAPERGGQRINHCRVNLPAEVLLPQWRLAELDCAARLLSWLERASTPEQPLTAFIDAQRTLRVCTLPFVPELPVLLPPDGELEWPRPPLGRLLQVNGRKMTAHGISWQPDAGFILLG